MDAVFGPRSFQNEIIWKRTGAHNDPDRYGANIDVLLFYAKEEKKVWNVFYRPHGAEYVARFRNKDADGRLWADDNLSAKGLSGGGYEYEYKGVKGYWRCPPDTMKRLDDEGKLHFTRAGGIRLKRYLDDTRGTVLQALWDDISPINSQAQERLGYPTQKPEALLERIVKASSNEGHLVLDPFCGCGTTIAVAERLNRRWIGIDITHLAITLMRHRLEDTFGSQLSPYEVIGDPKDLESARALAQDSQHEGRYQFEWWALGKVAARPAQDKKKGADTGIDGIINFFDDNTGKAKRIVIQVKSGGVKRGDIATLKGDMEREKSPIGVLITLEEPTRPMLQEAAAGGFYEPEHFPGLRYPRLQILTIEDLLSGKRIEYPRLAPEGTFKRAERKRKTTDGEQTQLL